MLMKKSLLVLFLGLFVAANAAVAQTKTFKDSLVVEINGEKSEPQETEILLEEMADGTCNLSLKNFCLGSGADVLGIGNINLSGVARTEENGVSKIATSQTIIIAEGDLEGIDMWMGPMLGEVPIVLEGEYTDEKLYCTIDIDMMASLQQIIKVTVGTTDENDEVVASPYLPNADFELWKGEAGNSYQTNDPAGERQRPGDEPTDWYGSSINQSVKVPLLGAQEKKETLIYMVDSEEGNGNAVQMQNKFVGVASIGSVAPGFVSFATPWVHAAMSMKECDGGVYGGAEFGNYRPDAIQGRFKRTVGEAEENAYIIAYLWNGTFKSKIGKAGAPTVEKEDVDRAVMGKIEATEAGTLVASCDYAFATTENNGWQTITVPLTYVDGTEDVTIEKMNVILSSGDYWTRGNLQKGSMLEADNVQFVYYSELESVTYDNASVTVAEAIDMSETEYDETKLALTSNGKFATIETAFDEETGVLTITVKGNDWKANKENQHQYTMQFKKKEIIPDAIESVDGTEAAKYDVYTLMGIQVLKQADSMNGLQKGLYIVNGKKMLVK